VAPCVSIIYPNFDLKTGVLNQNVLLWTTAQNVAPDRFQIIIGTAKLSLDEYQTLKSCLREGDEIVEVSNKENDNSMWNAGAKKSRHENLLFVEGHVTPDQYFLGKMLSYIEINEEVKALNTNSVNTKNSGFELLMDKWFDETLQLRSESHSFTFLTRQCFMLKKSVFEKFGPLVSEFEQFGPPYLSAILAENQIKIETVNFSNLIHENEQMIYKHHIATRSYVRGYMRAKDQVDNELLNEYFGTNPDFTKIDLTLHQFLKKTTWLSLFRVGLRSFFRKIKIRTIEVVIMNINIGMRLKFIWFKKVHRLVVVDQYENELLRGSRDNG